MNAALRYVEIWLSHLSLFQYTVQQSVQKLQTFTSKALLPVVIIAKYKLPPADLAKSNQQTAVHF